MSIFGDLERQIDDIYPYRWLVLALVLLGLAALTAIAYRRGWQHVVARNKLLTAFIVVPTLVLAIPLSYYLLSPLWTRTTLVEESPLAAVAASGLSTSVPAFPTAAPSMSASPTPAIREIPTVTVTATPSPPPTTAPDPQPAAAATVTPAPEPTAPEPTATLEPLPEPTATPEPEPEPEPEPTATPEPVAFVPHVVSQGWLSGSDEFHFAEGAVLLIETEPGVYVLRLENFSVRNGPDLYVYLSPSAYDVVDGALDLGGLRATDGSINYDVPYGTDISQFSGVVIWCRQFDVLFATAPLG